jgi:hypothetical protein
MSDLKSQALHAAERLRYLAGMGALPVNVKALARAQGIRSVKPLEMNASGRLLELGGFYVFYNAREDRRRQRFTVCHEIAHTFFADDVSARESGIKVRLGRNRPLDYTIEEQLCEWAAGELIMPRDRFVNAVNELSPSLSGLRELASRFDVTEVAALERIKALKLSWPCALLSWEPILEHGMAKAFRLIKTRSVGGFGALSFCPGSVVSLQGLHKAYDVFVRRHDPVLGVDCYSGCRIESRAKMQGKTNIELRSLATRQVD